MVKQNMTVLVKDLTQAKQFLRQLDDEYGYYHFVTPGAQVPVASLEFKELTDTLRSAFPLWQGTNFQGDSNNRQAHMGVAWSACQTDASAVTKIDLVLRRATRMRSTHEQTVVVGWSHLSSMGLDLARPVVIESAKPTPTTFEVDHGLQKLGLPVAEEQSAFKIEPVNLNYSGAGLGL